MTGLTCPACGSPDSEVCDSRPAKYGIRRRRACGCGERFTTVEVIVPASAERGLLVRHVIGPYGGVHAVAEEIAVGHDVAASELERRMTADRVLNAVAVALGVER